MSSNRKLMVMPGDGIGPEVMNETLRLLDWLAKYKNINFDDKNQILKKIDESGELYNSNKEYIDKSKENNYDLSLLVLQKDDVNARMKYESLSNRFKINGINKITRGVVWNISLNGGNIQDVLEQIINTNILYNQESHECYRIY